MHFHPFRTARAAGEFAEAGAKGCIVGLFELVAFPFKLIYYIIAGIVGTFVAIFRAIKSIADWFANH